MDAKSQVQQMNEIKLQAAEMIVGAMDDACEEESIEKRADMMSKLGAALYGLQITPEPFDPSTFSRLLAGGFGGHVPEEGGAVQ